jgi:hypothetical protein
MDFVQIGATRDGLDPYLRCARQRRMRAVLVETPAYLAWRKVLGRQPFDVEIAVAAPEDPEAVNVALLAAGIAPGLVLTGFERYVGSGFAVARNEFEPVDKYDQRMALAGKAWQPQLTGVTFPQVVKPSDGGGGLGVFLVDDEVGRAEAVERLRQLENYGGGEFARVLVEEYLDGVEFSVQGIAVGGKVTVLSFCRKVITIETVDGSDHVRGFREAGHVIAHGAHTPPGLRELAQTAVSAVGYVDGPFHLDAIDVGGRLSFLEMGFRLSGGALVALAQRVTGVSWAELAFRAHLLDGPVEIPQPPDESLIIGQVVAFTDGQLEVGQQLGGQVQRMPPAPVAETAGIPELASDMLRHNGFHGRVVVAGTTVDEVERKLRLIVEIPRTSNR